MSFLLGMTCEDVLLVNRCWQAECTEHKGLHARGMLRAAFKLRAEGSYSPSCSSGREDQPRHPTRFLYPAAWETAIALLQIIASHALPTKVLNTLENCKDDQ
jgi:hypothetical protein